MEEVRLSVIIPVFNEEENIEPLYRPEEGYPFSEVEEIWLNYYGRERAHSCFLHGW